MQKLCTHYRLTENNSSSHKIPRDSQACTRLKSPGLKHSLSKKNFFWSYSSLYPRFICSSLPCISIQLLYHPLLILKVLLLDTDIHPVNNFWTSVFILICIICATVFQPTLPGVLYKVLFQGNIAVFKQTPFHLEHFSPALLYICDYKIQFLHAESILA